MSAHRTCEQARELSKLALMFVSKTLIILETFVPSNTQDHLVPMYKAEITHLKQTIAKFSSQL